MEACAKINRTPPGCDDDDDDVGNLCRSMYVWPGPSYNRSSVREREMMRVRWGGEAVCNRILYT